MKAQLFLLMNGYGLMISFLDNLNHSQLSGAMGHLLKSARAGIFHRLPLPSRHFYLFSHINPTVCCLCLSISACRLLEPAHLLPRVPVWVGSLPVPSVTESKPVQCDHPGTNTLHRPGTGTLPLFFLLLPRNAKVGIAFL